MLSVSGCGIYFHSFSYYAICRRLERSKREHFLVDVQLVTAHLTLIPPDAVTSFTVLTLISKIFIHILMLREIKGQSRKKVIKT